MATSDEFLRWVPGGTSSVCVLYSSLLWFSGLLTLHFPICASWSLFLIFVVLVSFSYMISWVIHPCDSWWGWLVSHCCWFRPLSLSTCFLVASVLGTALSGWRIQCFLLRIRWSISHLPCILVVLLFWAPRGGAFSFGGPDIFPWLVQMYFRNLGGFWVIFGHVAFI